MSVTNFDPTLPFIGDEYETRNDYLIGGSSVINSGRVLTLTLGKLVPANTGDIPHSILLNDTDTTAGDVKAPYIVECDFIIETQLDYGTGTADEFREAFRSGGILLGKPNV